MNAVRHIFWKELVLHLWPAGRPSRATLLQWLPPVILVGGMAVIFAVLDTNGGDSVPMSFLLPFVLLFVMASLPSNLAMDSFAGERERHTLESVLATPITPRQLLWGKALAQLTMLVMGLVIALVLSIAIVFLTGTDAARTAPIALLLIVMTPIGFVFGVFLMLASTLASLKTPNVKAAMPQMMIYLLTGMGIGILPTAIFTPILVAMGLGPAEGAGALLVLVVVLQGLTVIAFLAFLGYLFMQVLRHTREDRFPLEV